MTLEIPPLDSEFEQLLQDIVKDRTCESPGSWTNSILPKILLRLSAITSIAIKDGEQFNRCPIDVDLKESIAVIAERISSQLLLEFKDEPPFTLLRLSELLLDPGANSYPLSNNVHVLKFLNSLNKLVMVSSPIEEYSQNGNDEVLEADTNPEITMNDVIVLNATLGDSQGLAPGV